jgi:hypothetical protein
MSLLEKQISGGKYLYFQYRDRDGNRSIYLGLKNKNETESRAKALWGAYQIAMIEDRFKKWVAGSEKVEWPIRSDWLERAKAGAVTDKDRLRIIVLAYSMLYQFHEDVCRHVSDAETEQCPTKLAMKSLKTYADKY